MADFQVLGELKPVPRAELIENDGFKYLTNHANGKGRWCLRVSEHDVDRCTYLHRKPEKAKSFVIIDGEPAPVPIAHLKDNRGLANVLGSERRTGTWCNTRGPHDEAACKYLHLGVVPNDKTVKIKDEEDAVKVSHLLFNSAVAYLLAHPDLSGVWCNNKVVHDVGTCRYVHRRVDEHPKVVSVDGEKFPIALNQLVENKAVQYLLDNPQCKGRWCGMSSPHDMNECSYLHRRKPFVQVDGDTVRITDLVSNRGLKYLLEHNDASGHWCKGDHDVQRPVETCSFIHYKENRAPTRGGGGGGAHYGSRGGAGGGFRGGRGGAIGGGPGGPAPGLGGGFGSGRGVGRGGGRGGMGAPYHQQQPNDQAWREAPPAHRGGGGPMGGYSSAPRGRGGAPGGPRGGAGGPPAPAMGGVAPQVRAPPQPLDRRDDRRVK